MDSQRMLDVLHTSGSQQSASVRQPPQRPSTHACAVAHTPQRRHVSGTGSGGQSIPARRMERS
jgi:hypothetical protein